MDVVGNCKLNHGSPTATKQGSVDLQWTLQRLTAMAAADEGQFYKGSYDDSMSDGNMNTVNTTFEDIYKWIPPP